MGGNFSADWARIVLGTSKNIEISKSKAERYNIKFSSQKNKYREIQMDDRSACPQKQSSGIK
jgi:hypothetical protein